MLLSISLIAIWYHQSVLSQDAKTVEKYCKAIYKEMEMPFV